MSTAAVEKPLTPMASAPKIETAPKRKRATPAETAAKKAKKEEKAVAASAVNNNDEEYDDEATLHNRSKPLLIKIYEESYLHHKSFQYIRSVNPVDVSLDRVDIHIGFSNMDEIKTSVKKDDVAKTVKKIRDYVKRYSPEDAFEDVVQKKRASKKEGATHEEYVQQSTSAKGGEIEKRQNKEIFSDEDDEQE